MLISLVWIISFIICFPPLIGWSSDGVSQEPPSLSSLLLTSEPEVPSGFVLTSQCSPQCILPSDPGYVLYSAIGSFFAPMMVMIFFNWRIYRVASKTTRAIRRGFTKVKSGEGGEATGSLMGIHR